MTQLNKNTFTQSAKTGFGSGSAFTGGFSGQDNIVPDQSEMGKFLNDCKPDSTISQDMINKEIEKFQSEFQDKKNVPKSSEENKNDSTIKAKSDSSISEEINDPSFKKELFHHIQIEGPDFNFF